MLIFQKKMCNTCPEKDKYIEILRDTCSEKDKKIEKLMGEVKTLELICRELRQSLLEHGLGKIDRKRTNCRVGDY